MYEYNFKRIEKKYVLTEKQKNLLFDKISDYIKEDKFHKSNIYNIYFDTKNNDLIINSIDKPLFKEKFRIRSYKIPTLEDKVFFEIKSKYKGIVGKRRCVLKLKELYDYIENKKFDESNQIMKEINYYYQLYNLKPVIFIAYDRLSYCSKTDEALRITIDSNLRSRRYNLRLEQGDKGKKYFEDEKYIMEIKTIGSMPLWLVRTLSELKIYPTTFSKYGNIYKKERIVYA